MNDTIKELIFKYYDRLDFVGDVYITSTLIEFSLLKHKVSTSNSAKLQSLIGALRVEGIKVKEKNLSTRINIKGDVVTDFSLHLEDLNLSQRVTRPSMKILLGLR